MQQQVLEQYPDVDLAIDVIWMPMLPTDNRDAWDSEFLADPRVTQFWDEERIVGRWFADKQNFDLGDHGEIIWDAFLLFGPEASWEDVPSDLLVWGTPIVGRIPELMDALGPLLTEATEAAPPSPTALTLDVRKETVRVDHASVVVA